jgi:hypothetical protein
MQAEAAARHTGARRSMRLDSGWCCGVAALLLGGAQLAFADGETGGFSPTASITHYVIGQSSPFFSGTGRHWMETSVRAGGSWEHGAFTLEGGLLALKTSGRDPYGSGSAPAGAPLGAPGPGNDPQVNLDTLLLRYSAPGERSFRLTLGRQSITLGSQFLIGDGAYDGYHRRYPQAVYHNPRRSFDALRLEFDTAMAHVEAFAYRVHPTWDGGGERNGWLAGAELSRQFKDSGSTLAAGVFYRESESSLDNDMWIASARGALPLPGAPEFRVSAEWAGEFGTGRNAFYVDRPGKSLHEHAGHAEIGWQSERPARPFAEAGYVYFSKDFTPVAQGFSDWGKWYLGNQIDWIIFGTNTRIARAQAGFWPLETVKLRIQYHNTRLASGPGGTLSDEWSLIGEWYPNARVWVNVLVGYSDAGSALGRSGLVNPFSYINQGAVPMGNRSSVDLVLALGFNF